MILKNNLFFLPAFVCKFKECLVENTFMTS